MTDLEKEFHQIPNPYIVGKPIEGRDMFFGRLDDFEFIRKKVSGAEKGGIIVLCGSRRSGKTSILFQINEGRLGEEFVPVLIDMQSMTARSDKEFLSKLVVDVIAAVKDDRISLQEDYIIMAKDNPYSAFQKFSKKVSKILGNKKLIIMFDEYELFETHIGKGNFSIDILNALSSWMEHRKGVFLIFTGSDKLESRKTAFWERFLPKATHRRISFISRADTSRLIHEPVSGMVNFKEGVEDEIYNLTAGQPFYTQVICQTIIDHLNEHKKYTVSLSDINEVVTYIVENPLPQMIFAWNVLSDYGKFILSIMGELSKEDNKPIDIEEICKFPEKEQIGYKFDSNKIRESAENLFHSDYLEKAKSGEKYSFKMDLWRRWIVLMHSIWQVINELSSDGHEMADGIIHIKTEKKNIARKSFSVLIVIAVIITASIIFINNYIASNDADNNVIPVSFTRDSASVSINSKPSGAIVFLGDEYFGQTPILSESAEAGSVSVRVTLEGYRTYFDTLFIENLMPVEKNYTLVEKTGVIYVTSVPEGASIFIDGKESGERTPSKIEGLSVNELHRIILRADGYEDVIREGIKVKAQELTEISMNLPVRKYPLTIESIPYGAEIYLDGEMRGLTPTSFPAVNQGKHVLELIKQHYETEKMIIKVPVENNRLSINLNELLPGTLTIIINPWADLYIDGKLIKKEALSNTAELREGMHVIELVHRDYGHFADTLSIVSGADTTINYMLREMRGK